MGDQSDRSDAQSPAPSAIRDEEEHDLSDENVSEVDDREYKDEGNLQTKTLAVRFIEF